MAPAVRAIASIFVHQPNRSFMACSQLPLFLFVIRPVLLPYQLGKEQPMKVQSGIKKFVHCFRANWINLMVGNDTQGKHTLT